MSTLLESEPLRILVVDDRAAVCEIVLRMLARLGVRDAISANGGAEALHLIEHAAEPYDVAIFDIDMPADDGLVCLRNLARLRTKPAVILMSGKDPLVLESAQRLGEDLGITILATLPKPITSAALKLALEALPQAGVVTKPAPSLMLSSLEVEKALDEERLEVWFQPQYDIAARRILGAEALVRIRRHGGELIRPDAFIKSAEDGGLMPRLTDFLLEQCTASSAAWQAAGWPMTVSLNLSKAGLDDLSLPDRAAAICRSRDLPAKHLCFELTESSFAANRATVLDILSRLRLKGFRLSLDDFGTGYASMEELRSLPFHELKLDKQFVQSAAQSPRSRAILESSIRLAAELRLAIVAEGVETQEMLEMVSAMGCHVAQGHLIGRPIPAEGFLESLVFQSSKTSTTLVNVIGQEGPADSSPARPPAPPPAQPVLSETVLRFAHDAASPLMIVLGLSETLLDEPSLSTEQQTDLRQIHEAAEEVTALLKALQRQIRDNEQRDSHTVQQIPVTPGRYRL